MTPTLSQDKTSQDRAADAAGGDGRRREDAQARREGFWIKRVLPRSLLGRSVLIIVTPLILTQVIATWIFYERHYDNITKRLSESLAGSIAVILQVMGDDPEAARLSGELERTTHMLWLEDVTWDVGARFPPGPAPEPRTLLDRKLTIALEQRLRHPFRIDTRSLDRRVRIDIQLPDRVVHVLVARKRLFSSTTYIFIIWMVAASIILFGVATVFMRNQVKPIRRLAHAAESFGKGRDVPRFKPEGAREVRQAATAFLRMRERIQRNIAQRTEMLAGVSHDLRTPLTRMKLQLAMMGEWPEAQSLTSDVDDMQRMVEGYLAFARGEGTEQPTRTDLAALLREVCEQMDRDDRPVDLHVEEALVLDLKPESIKRTLTNLIGNAQRHGRQVMVSAGRRGTGVEVTVDDDGPGIPAEMREEVFKPFFRLDQSRNPATGGTGLGLSIARDVARSHGGDVTLEDAPGDAPGGGLRARLRLPL